MVESVSYFIDSFRYSYGCRLKAIHKTVFALVVLTLVVVLLYGIYGDRRVLAVTPDAYSFYPTSDQGQGGRSQASLATESQRSVLQCKIRSSEKYRWPYCGVSIHIDSRPDIGLDLTHYHTIKLAVSLTNQAGESVPMRFYLRNFNPAYSTIDDEYTHKYNGLEFLPPASAQEMILPKANLQVMTWWLADLDIPIEHAAPEFTNVNRIEFATGSGMDEGDYTLVIERIEFIGEYVSGETLMALLLACWVGLALSYSMYEIKRSRLAIQRVKARQHHLHAMNQSLRAKNIEFAELAHRDPLTGAMNRHAIRDWLNKHYDDLPIGGKVLSILYLDIDHFKQVNDEYGHAIGDDILKEFTMVLLTSLQAEQRLVRWGGEEFVVFCPGMNLLDTYELGERLRRKVEAHIWVHGDPLTTSIGVATLGEERTNEMLIRADEALYKAKRSGRNRVELSE